MDQQKTLLKSRNAIMKFLPRATSSVAFQSHPIYSPAKDKRPSEKTQHKSNLGIGFSGPLVSMVPAADTRRKIIKKNNSDYATIVYEQPTSPRVSCMGQVKCKYQKDKLQRAKNNDKVVRRLIDARTHNFDDDHEETPKKTDTNKSKKKLGFKKIFSVVATPRKKDMGNKISKAAPLYLDDDNKVPNLSTMKRFTSGRGKFSSIDWTKEIARMDEDDEQDVIVMMPSSAPVVIRNSLGFDDKFIRVAGINKEPKKEINLWKRRTLPQPKPLQVNIGI